MSARLIDAPSGIKLGYSVVWRYNCAMEFRLFKRTRCSVLLPVLLDEGERVFELGTRFLNSLVDSPKEYSAETINLYGKNLKYFGDYLRRSDLYRHLSLDHVVSTLASGVIEQYLRQLPLESATLRNRDATLRRFFEWLTTEQADYARKSSGYETGLKTRKPKRKVKRYIHQSQVITLLNGLNHESQRVAVHTLYDTGLRLSELPRVLKEDIDALERWPDEYSYLPLLIRGSKGQGGDHIKERYSLISRAVYSRIKRYHSSIEYRLARFRGKKPAFLNTHKQPLTKSSIKKSISDAALRSGLKTMVISAHRLRHGTALSFLQGEIGEEYLEKMVIIQVQLGHSAIATTEIYADIPPSLFMKFNKNHQVLVRFEQAQEIYDATYLQQFAHVERRGRKSS